MASRSPRVMVMWSNPKAANLGVRALAEGTAGLLRRSFGRDTVVDYPVFEDEPLRGMLSNRSLAVGLLTTAGRLHERVRSYDFLVESGGGDSFTDIYGLSRLARMAHVHRVASKARIPVVLGPQTIGPFETFTGRAMGRRMLRTARIVLARDPASAEHARVLGRTPDALATDVVFTLPQPASIQRRDIVLNVSGLLWSENSHIDFRQYRVATRALVRAALADGRSITVLPHVLDNPSIDNDVPVSLELKDEFADVELYLPSSLADARAVLGSAEVVVGSRMHACLNALSAGTAAFPWAYSRKFLPLMSDLGWINGVDLRTEADPASLTLTYLRKRDKAADLERIHGLRERAALRLQSAVDALRLNLSEHLS